MGSGASDKKGGRCETFVSAIKISIHHNESYLFRFIRRDKEHKDKHKNRQYYFQVWVRNRLISAGLNWF